MNHYVFVYPGERVFLMLQIAGEDCWYVLEVRLPTSSTNDGKVYHECKEPEVVQYAVLELNELLNLMHGYHETTLIGAFAANNEELLTERK